MSTSSLPSLVGLAALLTLSRKKKRKLTWRRLFERIRVAFFARFKSTKYSWFIWSTPKFYISLATLESLPFFFISLTFQVYYIAIKKIKADNQLESTLPLFGRRQKIKTDWYLSNYSKTIHSAMKLMESMHDVKAVAILQSKSHTRNSKSIFIWNTCDSSHTIRFRRMPLWSLLSMATTLYETFWRNIHNTFIQQHDDFTALFHRYFIENRLNLSVKIIQHKNLRNNINFAYRRYFVL